MRHQKSDFSPSYLTLSDSGILDNYDPPTISKTILSIFTLSYMCILLGVLGMFQLEFFLICDFDQFTAILK